MRRRLGANLRQSSADRSSQCTNSGAMDINQGTFMDVRRGTYEAEEETLSEQLPAAIYAPVTFENVRYEDGIEELTKVFLESNITTLCPGTMYRITFEVLP